MKTTNFENSKKLAEIGFENDNFNFYHSKYYSGLVFRQEVEQKYDINDFVPAYDFETIWDALPKKIKDYELTILTDHNHSIIGYYTISGNYEEGIDRLDDLFVNQFYAEGESCDFKMQSLADTAACLIVKLHKTGIINFNK